MASKLTEITWSAELPLLPVVESLPYHQDWKNRIDLVLKSYSFKYTYRAKLIHLIELFATLNISTSTTLISTSKSAKIELEILAGKKVHVLVPNPPIGLRVDFIEKVRPSEDHVFDAIFFGRMIPQKGLYDILKIWKRVIRSSYGKYMLGVIGFPNQKFLREFKELLRKYSIDKYVKLVGYVPYDTLLSIIKASSVTIYPSKIDTFSLSILESLACNTPVVAYRILPQVLNFSKYLGVYLVDVENYVQFAHKVLYILENNDYVKRNTYHQSKQIISKFTWNNVARAESQIYRQIIDRYSAITNDQ